MQSAFVDIGLERDAFLYVSDFFEDNEEYDKIVTSVEEKVLRLEKGVPAAAGAVPRRRSERARERPGGSGAGDCAAPVKPRPAGAGSRGRSARTGTTGTGVGAVRAGRRPGEKDRGRGAFPNRNSTARPREARSAGGGCRRRP